MPIDIHSHSTSSPDGHASPEQMVQAAIERGIEVYALTEHCDAMRFAPFGMFPCVGETLSRYDEPAVRERFFAAKEKYAGQIKLLYGLELGEPHFRPDEARELVLRQSYDFIIGDIHLMGEDADVVPVVRYAGNPESALRNYLADYYETIKLGLFDSMGHLDYPLRYLSAQNEYPRSFYPLRAEVDDILRCAVGQSKGIEINGKGLSSPLKAVEPELWVLKRYKELGGEYLTYGSDAHNTDRLLFGWNEAVALAKEAGFDRFTYFENRKPHPYFI